MELTVKSPQGQLYWCGTWQTGPTHPPGAIFITIQDPKNGAVRGALHKLQRDIPAKRATSEYLMEGINKWCAEEWISRKIDYIDLVVLIC